MHNTWIKLYRKAMDHPVFSDESAWRVWTWILMSVDYETGEMTFGRFRDAEALKMNPSKFRHIIDRLRGKYDLIETTNQHSHTRLKVKNWHKYQSQSDSIVDNSEVRPDVRPQAGPQAIEEVRPQVEIQITAQEQHNLDVDRETGPQIRPQGSLELGPQPTATNKATNQEDKNNKEIKNNSPNGEVKIFGLGISQERRSVYTAYQPPFGDDEPESLTGEVVKLDKEGKPIKVFGKDDVGEGMSLLTGLLGRKLSKQKHDLNVYALLRLYKERGKEKTLDMLRYSFSVHDDKYSPKIYNYLDLEDKWEKIVKYQERNSHNGISRGAPLAATYDNVIGGVSW